MFYHVYTSGEWGILILPPEDGPRFQLNQTVLEMSREKAMVGIYLSTTPRIVIGDLTYVLSNWLPTRYEIHNEMFLAAAGLGRSCNKDNFLLSSVWIYFNAKFLTFSLFQLWLNADSARQWQKDL